MCYSSFSLGKIESLITQLGVNFISHLRNEGISYVCL